MLATVDMVVVGDIMEYTYKLPVCPPVSFGSGGFFIFRGIYLKYLVKLENTLKTVISHSFSEKYGYDN